MSLILGSERKLFDRHIVETDLNADDFEITKEEDAPGAIQHMDKGTVTVTYKPTGVVRHYRDGIVPPPRVEFDRELKKDMFKMR